MEGFLESFLYLLITIVILVLSMRKKKPVESETEEAPQSGDPFSDIFGEEEPEEQERDEQEEQAQPAMVSPYQDEEQEKSIPWMSETDAKDSLMDVDQVMKEAAENNPIARYEGQVESDAYTVGLEDDQIRFDLKKAVIYSEILERRSF